MQPKLLLLPTSSRGLITVTVSSWAHPILSSNLSRKFKTLLQDSFSWHLVITTRHLSWKSCTGCPFQSALIQSCMHVLPCYKWIWSYLPLWTLTYLHSVSHTSLFFGFPHAQNPTIQTQPHGFRTFTYFGPYVWNSLPQDIRQCSTLTSFKTNLKTFLFSQDFCSS